MSTAGSLEKAPEVSETNFSGGMDVIDCPEFIDFCRRVICDLGQEEPPYGVRDLSAQVPEWITRARKFILENPETPEARFLGTYPLFSPDIKVLCTLHTYVMGGMPKT